MKVAASKVSRVLTGAIGVAIILPMFFQFGGGLFRERAMVYDSMGLISRLPLPISIAVCFIGTLLIGRYRDCKAAFAFSGSTMLLMAAASFLASGGLNQTKLITMAQFALPMMGFVLGQMYYYIDRKLRILSRMLLVAVVAIVVLELYSSWILSYTMLIPYIVLTTRQPLFVLFSIYQHLQYVPVVMSASYVVLLFGLRGHTDLKPLVWVFVPIMVLYLIVSTSLIALLLFGAGLIVYALCYVNTKKLRSKTFITLITVIIALTSGYLYFYRGQHMLEEKLHIVKQADNGGIDIPGISKRSSYWVFYGCAIMSDARSFLTGHVASPSRDQHTSAHNYYLDFLYHFGFLSFLPLVFLIAATLYGLFRKRREIISSPELAGLALVVLYLLFVENMLKVALRQPYPGIFTFFLWGILLSRLSLFSAGKNAEQERMVNELAQDVTREDAV